MTAYLSAYGKNNISIKQNLAERIPMRLFHYTTIDAFLKIWTSKQLRFSSNLNLNDPFEKHKGYDIPWEKDDFRTFIQEAKQFDKVYSGILSSYQQISFTKNLSSKIADGFSSPAMWGHYAHNENGVCIEIDSEKLPKIPNIIKKRSVLYTKYVPVISYHIPMILEEIEIDKIIQQHIKELFFTKHIDWKYEREYRIIAKADGELFLPLNDSILSVTVYDFAGINTDIIERIIQDEVPIYGLHKGSTDGKRQLDRIDLKRYRRVMSGEHPQKPDIILPK